VSCPLLLDEMFSDTITQQLRAKGHDVIAQAHAGLVLVSTKTFPQDRSCISAVTSALAVLLDKHAIQADQVIFLTRH
jgi:hypothetical protein